MAKQTTSDVSVPAPIQLMETVRELFEQLPEHLHREFNTFRGEPLAADDVEITYCSHHSLDARWLISTQSGPTTATLSLYSGQESTADVHLSGPDDAQVEEVLMIDSAGTLRAPEYLQAHLDAGLAAIEQKLRDRAAELQAQYAKELTRLAPFAELYERAQDPEQADAVINELLTSHVVQWLQPDARDQDDPYISFSRQSLGRAAFNELFEDHQIENRKIFETYTHEDIAYQGKLLSGEPNFYLPEYFSKQLVWILDTRGDEDGARIHCFLGYKDDQSAQLRLSLVFPAPGNHLSSRDHTYELTVGEDGFIDTTPLPVKLAEHLHVIEPALIACAKTKREALSKQGQTQQAIEREARERMIELLAPQSES